VSKLAEVLGELIGERVRIEVSHPRVIAGDAVSLVGPKVALATADGAVRVQVELEAELARTLHRTHPGATIPTRRSARPSTPEMEGATLAIVMQVVRRAHGPAEVLRALGAGALRMARRTKVALAATVWLGSDAFAAQAFVDLRKIASAFAPAAPHELASIAELPVSLGVVVARSTAEAIDVYALEPGDVWMPGRGWLLARRASAAPTWSAGCSWLRPASERAWAGTLGEQGQNRASGRRADLGRRGEALSDSEHDHDTATSKSSSMRRSSSA